MKLIKGLILLTIFGLVAYTGLRDVVFFSKGIGAKDSGTWQEYYNFFMGCVLVFIHVKGYSLLFAPINKVSAFRSLMGLIMLSVLGITFMNDTVHGFLFIRNPEDFYLSAINAGWAIIGGYSFLKGTYCLLSGNRFIPGFDDGDYTVTLKGLTEASISSGSNATTNGNIQRVVDYRNSLVGMMPNDQAVSELAKTAGIEQYVNDNSNYASYLDSQLGMQSNSSAYQYIQNLFGSK